MAEKMHVDSQSVATVHDDAFQCSVFVEEEQEEEEEQEDSAQSYYHLAG